MFKNGFFRVLVSSSAGLLLLTTASVTLVQRADGTSSTSDVFGVACIAEISSCQADKTCVGCFHPRVVESAEFEACGAAMVADDVESSTMPCVDVMAEPCCIDDLSEHDCLGNGAFQNVIVCLLATRGCSEDAMMCAGSTAAGSTAAASVAAAPPSVSAVCAIAVVLTFLMLV